LVEQAENRQQILRENYESNEEEKRVQKLAENIFNYRNYRGDTISAGNDVRKQRIIDSIHAIADKNYQLIGEFIVEKGFAPFRMGLEYSNNSDLRYFLFQVDSTWYIKNKDFIKNEIAKGNLSPNALYMYNRHLTIQLKDSLTTPEMYFNLLNEWGISPYFEWENFTLPRKGFASARMRYYDLYEQEKYRFNCIDFNK